MKKVIWIAIVSIAIAVILTTNSEWRVYAKQCVGMGVSVEEIQNLTWYKKYQSIQIGDSLEFVEKKLGEHWNKDDIGLMNIWNFSYGNLKVGFLNDHVIHKQIIIPNLKAIDLDETVVTNMNGYTTKEDVLTTLGKSIEFGKGYDLKTNTEHEIYLWKLKTGKILLISFAEGTIFEIKYL